MWNIITYLRSAVVTVPFPTLSFNMTEKLYDGGCGMLSLCLVQGEGNPGFEVLLQNLKAGISASKELGEFVKER